jgi:N-acylneuraminate cytidylyltransferase/CMP-N,N'-diacetyllegionaminic acid synthase
MSKKILAIIGLRSGSKGLKNKNIKLLGGIPLFAHILKSAKKSKLINRLVISTDSKHYQKLAKKWGADSPFLRPRKLAKDSSYEIDFIKDLLKKLKKKENYVPDIIVRLLATCPFQKSLDIDRVIKKVLFKDYDSAVIISKSRQHPEKALKIIGSKRKYLTTYISNNPLRIGSKQNRQDFKSAYVRSNVIACKKFVIEKYNSLTSQNTGFIIIPHTVDIDDKLDFDFANYYLKNKKL